MTDQELEALQATARESFEAFEARRRANRDRLMAEADERERRGRVAFVQLREVLGQPGIYFTTDRPLPRIVCSSARTMDPEDDPGEWYHPDVGRSQRAWVPLRDGEVGDVIPEIGDPGDVYGVGPAGAERLVVCRTVRRCRFCGHPVVVVG